MLKCESISIQQLASQFGGYLGDTEDIAVRGLSVLSRARSDQLALADHPNGVKAADESAAKVILCSPNVASKLKRREGLWIHDNPRLAFAMATECFRYPYVDVGYAAQRLNTEIAETAVIARSAIVGPGVSVGERVAAIDAMAQ